jgi:hypothetical protein
LSGGAAAALTFDEDEPPMDAVGGVGVYAIDDIRRFIVVARIAHRRDVYRP